MCGAGVHRAQQERLQGGQNSWVPPGTKENGPNPNFKKDGQQGAEWGGQSHIPWHRGEITRVAEKLLQGGS